MEILNFERRNIGFPTYSDAYNWLLTYDYKLLHVCYTDPNNITYFVKGDENNNYNSNIKGLSAEDVAKLIVFMFLFFGGFLICMLI